MSSPGGISMKYLEPSPTYNGCTGSLRSCNLSSTGGSSMNYLEASPPDNGCTGSLRSCNLSSTGGSSMNYLEVSPPDNGCAGSLRSCNSTSSLYPPSLSESEQVYMNYAYDYGESSGVSSCTSHDYEDLQSVRTEAKSISGPRKKTNELYESTGNSNPRKKINDVYEPSRPRRERQITECSDMSTASSVLSDALPSKHDTCLSKLILFLILAISVSSLILVGLLMTGKVCPNCGCSQEKNHPAPITGGSVSVQSLLRRIDVLESDLQRMQQKMNDEDKAVKIFFAQNENKMEFLQTQLSAQNRIVNVTAGKVEFLQAELSTQRLIINETEDKMVSAVNGVWVNMSSADKTMENKLVTGLKVLKTSIKSLNQSDGKLISEVNELTQNQIRSRGMTKRLWQNVTQLELRVQEVRRSSRNISSRVWSLERGYAQMNTLMKKIHAVNDAQNLSHTSLQTAVKRLNGSLINLNVTLYNKTSVSSVGKAGIDISKCKLERKTGVAGSAGSAGSTAYSEAVYTKQTNKRIMGMTCSTDYARDYKLEYELQSSLYKCECRGVSSSYANVRSIKCFLYVWECPIS